MNDPRISKHPDFSPLFAVIPLQEKDPREEDGCLMTQDRPCSLCGCKGEYFRYDKDFGSYLCPSDYYGMYWNPVCILEGNHFTKDHFLPEIDKKLLYNFVVTLLEENSEDKFAHLTIIEVE